MSSERTINHVGLSSGKDSTALLGWIIHESGYPRETIRASFCDTENEYPEVYRQIDDLDSYCRSHGVAPIRRLRSMGFLQLAIAKNRFPGAVMRFCTDYLKFRPTIALFQEYALDGYDVVSHSGVRRDESVARSMLDEWDFDKRLNCRVRRALLDWSVSDIWAAHHKYGLPINPLYRGGWKRVGCRLCVMSNKADVRQTARKRPEVIDEIREWERVVGGQTPNGEHSSFFPSGHIPYTQCSRTHQNEDGLLCGVPTIDDVVRWATTTRGGVQQGMDFLFDEDDAAHPCMSGYCE